MPEIVECLSCGWRGEPVVCIIRDGVACCPLDGGPVESECDPPSLILDSNEPDPNAITK